MPKMCHHYTCVEDSIFTKSFEKFETLLEKGLYYLSQNLLGKWWLRGLDLTQNLS